MKMSRENHKKYKIRSIFVRNHIVTVPFVVTAVVVLVVVLVAIPLCYEIN